tara:strand:- start:338 stop:697 length:360 start_codon:yes stop_codon:yes gene_type:complete
MPRKKRIDNITGLSDNTNLSYEGYLKAALALMSDQFSIRVYKLAPKNEYPIFERGKDIRVQFYCNKKRIYEFIIEKMFYYQSNRNKEDRAWMRTHASVHLNMVKNAIIRKEKNVSKIPG